MLDVVAALHWLHLNAAAFGGDAGRLTLIGVGQGAALVNLLMISPLAKGNSIDFLVCYLFLEALLLFGGTVPKALLAREPSRTST